MLQNFEFAEILILLSLSMYSYNYRCDFVICFHVTEYLAAIEIDKWNGK